MSSLVIRSDFYTSSDYLSNIQRQQALAAPTEYATCIAQLEAQRERIQTLAKAATNLEDVQQQLRHSKAKFDFYWAAARFALSPNDTAQAQAFDQLGTMRSRYAADCIQTALMAAWHDASNRRYLPTQYQQPDTTIPGLFILGMGKLGGFDLNFSSDVDLIAFYDPEQLPVSDMHGRAYVCVRVLKSMTKLLSELHQGRFVWRVDWRLRPDASATQIVMSTGAAFDFYQFRSLPWHRLAMVKARCVAGDQTAGEAFLASLNTYIWRQNLDFSAVDEVRRLKEKINQEHPQLKLARQQAASGDQSGHGFNLKLGHGGIREIEFIANAMQLLWGGKKSELRQFSTVKVLQALSDSRLLTPDVAAELINHYRQLRQIEDAVQALDNLQTHALPSATATQAMAKLLATDPQALLAHVSETSTRVKSCYDRFFSTFHTDSTDSRVEAELAAIEGYDELPEASRRVLDLWQDGFGVYGARPQEASQLAPLLNALIALLKQNPTRVVKLIEQLHEFFRAIPNGGQYLRLLSYQPKLCDDVLEPLVYSPAMSTLIEQSPQIIDFLLEPAQSPIADTPFDSDFVLANTDFEVRMQRLRRFVNEQLYGHMLAVKRGSMRAQQLQSRLTELATHSLQLGLQITAESMELDAVPISILGMGKLGMEAMAPLSDLDLIFVCNPNVDPELANRFSQRFRHLMEAKTAEGRAYEMDMRLRPSGRSGPPTVTLEGFRSYHQKSAKNWEHIALIPARPVAGNPDTHQQIGALRAQILGRPRDQRQFLMDAAKMHNRVREQRLDRAEQGALNVKLRSGGLFEAEYLSACHLILSDQAERLVQQSYRNSVTTLHAELGQPALSEITAFWRSLQIWERMLGMETLAADTLPAKLYDRMLEDLALESPQALAQKVEASSTTVSTAIQMLFGEIRDQRPSDWADWEENPVIWVDD